MHFECVKGQSCVPFIDTNITACSMHPLHDEDTTPIAILFPFRAFGKVENENNIAAALNRSFLSVCPHHTF